MKAPFDSHSFPVLPLLAAAILVFPPGAFAASDEGGAIAASHRPDAVALRLAPSAARAARPAPEAGARFVTGVPAAPGLEPAGARFAALGLAALDGLAARLGGAWFEREFPGEVAPPADSPDADFTAFWILHFAPSDPEPVAASLRALAEVADAWPIARVPVAAVPDDSLWSAAYHLFQPSRHDIHAVEAWDVTTGDTNIVVSIVDTGVLLDHPDLADQIWINRAERTGLPGVDDDGNGYVDDDRGWDFVALASADEAVPGEDGLDQDPDPNDFVGHGTGVAGVAGAATDNRIGVAGVAWRVRLMALRIGWSAASNPSGESDLAYAAQAIRYSTRMGADVINCSFETVPQPDLAAAVTAATRAGVAVVVAAGNNGSPHSLGLRDDVISVAATDRTDKVTSFSNRGDYVDLAAPGWEIATTALHRPGSDSTGLRQPTYTRFANGTSFSAPMVAGVAALAQAQRRASGQRLLTPAEVLLRLVETADDISAQNPGITGYGAGRLNAARAVSERAGSIQLDARVVVAGPVVVAPAVSGGMRIALVTRDGRYLVIDPARGVTMREVALPAAARSGLAAADLGDGRGLGLFFAGADGRIHGLTSAGDPLPGWPVTAAGPRVDDLPAPALGDLDGDGTPEIVWARGLLFAWRADGSLLPGFPVGPGAGPFALAPLDDRPGLEIVFADDSPFNVGTVRAYGGDGQALPGWPNAIWDPAIDLVVATPGAGGARVVACGGSNTVGLGAGGETRWRRSQQLAFVGGLSLADLDRDGTDEVLLARGLEVWSLDLATGAPRPGWPIRTPAHVAGPAVVGHAGAARYGLFVPALGNGLPGYDGGGSALSGFPKAVRASDFPALSDLDGDGRTEVFAAGGADSTLFAYDVGAGTWTSAPQPWPTARGNPARTGGNAGAPPTGSLDDVGPAAVSDLVPGSALRSIDLAWTAPADESGDRRARRYELRFAPAPLDEATFASGTLASLSPPAPPGTREAVTLAGLAEGATYHVALRSFDAAGNASPLSPSVSAATRSISPAAITTLLVAAGNDTSVTLRWTATGDDGLEGRPARYHVHAAPWPLDAANFENAPIRIGHAPGGARFETARVGGFATPARHWFAVEAEDEAGNRSGISNVVSAWPGPLATRQGLAVAPIVQPARPPTEILWQAPGALPGARHAIAIYDVGGRVRRTLATDPGTEGSLPWDGADDAGRPLEAGVYFVRFTGAGGTVTGRLVLLR